MASATREITRLAVMLDLTDVAAHRFPALDLARVLPGKAAAPVVAAIPLKPSARIGRMNPAFSPPLRKGQARSDTEIVQRCFSGAFGKLCPRKPATREFVGAVTDVFPTKHAKPKHFRGAELRAEFQIKVAPRRFAQLISIVFLHPIINEDGSFSHQRSLFESSLHRAERRLWLQHEDGNRCPDPERFYWGGRSSVDSATGWRRLGPQTPLGWALVVGDALKTFRNIRGAPSPTPRSGNARSRRS